MVNFDEVVRFINSTFPSKKWRVFPPSFANMTETCKNYCHVLFIFQAAGSNVMNLVFSNRNIGQVILYFRPVDSAFPFSAALHVWSECLYSRFINNMFSKFTVPRNFLDTIKNGFLRVFYAMQNNEWPPNEDGYACYFMNGDFTPRHFNLSGAGDCHWVRERETIFSVHS